MAAELEDIVTAPGGHVVQFYDSDAELSFMVGQHLAEAVRSGEVGVVIATEAHRRGFAEELAAAGIDVAEAGAAGALVWRDAGEAMAILTTDGSIDAEAFHRFIGGLLRQAARTGRPVRAYGEIVALLWDAGHVLAAIELERLWNELAREVEFSLLCAYRSASVSDPEQAEALREVCQLHSSIVPGPRREPRPAGVCRSAGHEVSARFPHDRDAPRAARRFVLDALRGWGHGGAVLADAELLVSELATNAVLHARSPFVVGLRGGQSEIQISVHDASRAAPRRREPAPWAASGRGLNIVAALAAGWGVELTPAGKTVWARLPNGTASCAERGAHVPERRLGLTTPAS